MKRTLLVPRHRLGAARRRARLAVAQAARPAARRPPHAGASPSKLVLDNSTRILTTLEKRRAEFTQEPRRAARSSSPANSTACSTATTPRAWCWAPRPRRVGRRRQAVRRRAGRQPDAALRLLAAGLQHQAEGAGEVGNAAAAAAAASRCPARCLRQGGEPIPVDYLMRKIGSQWKVFDVMVEGVSLRADLPQPVRRAADAEVDRARSPPTCAPASCRPAASNAAMTRRDRAASRRRRAGVRRRADRAAVAGAVAAVRSAARRRAPRST